MITMPQLVQAASAHRSNKYVLYILVIQNHRKAAHRLTFFVTMTMHPQVTVLSGEQQS